MPDTTLNPSLKPYRIIGIIYLVLGAPSLIALVTGRLHRGGDAYFAMSFMGVPLGLVLLMYAVKRHAPTYLTDVGMKLGGAGLFSLGFMLLSWLVIRSGYPSFQTAYRFFGMSASFLASLCLALMLMSRLRERSQD